MPYTLVNDWEIKPQQFISNLKVFCSFFKSFKHDIQLSEWEVSRLAHVLQNNNQIAKMKPADSTSDNVCCAVWILNLANSCTLVWINDAGPN